MDSSGFSMSDISTTCLRIGFSFWTVRLLHFQNKKQIWFEWIFSIIWNKEHEKRHSLTYKTKRKVVPFSEKFAKK